MDYRITKKKGGEVVKQLISNSNKNKKITDPEIIKKSLSNYEKKQLINSVYKNPQNKLSMNMKENKKNLSKKILKIGSSHRQKRR